MDLTTAYYIVDSADDMLTAEELALRPEAEALINAGPAETVVTFETVETSVGPMTIDRLWDLHYRGENGNVSDDEMDEYLAAEAYLAAKGAAEAAAEETRKAELAALHAEEAAEEERELVEKFGADTLATVRAWYETHNKFGLADSFLDAMVDSGVMEDTLDEDELGAFEAYLAEGELSDADEDDIHELAMERVADYPEHFPISNAMIDGLGDIDPYVANEIIHGF